MMYSTDLEWQSHYTGLVLDGGNVQFFMWE